MDDNILDQKWSAGSLLRFAFPTIVMMIFMGLYTIVDTIFVAQFVNTDALSSINIVCPIINVTVGLGTMIATGGNAIVSRKMGAGENQEAKEDFTLLIITGAVIGFYSVRSTQALPRWESGSRIQFPRQHLEYPGRIPQ